MLDIGIIGLGLIGGSLGLALHKYTDNHILGLDRDEKNIHYALENGIIDHRLKEEMISDLNLLFLAVPVKSVYPLLKKYYHLLRKRAIIVSDMGSTKNQLYYKITKELPEVNYIGGHPLAGKELSGPENAEADLFYDKKYILLKPENEKQKNAAKKITNILKKINCKVIYMTPEKHDRLLSFSSHLPQLLSTALMLEYIKMEEEHCEISNLLGTGFQDMTRLAASDPDMWVDILTTNNRNICNNINNFIDSLTKMKEIIENKDQDKIFSCFKDARDKRKDI